MSNKKAVIIGASFDSVHTIKVAKKQGIFIVAIDGNPNACGFEYADESIVVDISDIDTVYFIVKEINPDFLLTAPIGKYLFTTGYINDKLGLRGIKYTPALNSVDKYLFHQKLSENKLRNITNHLVNKDIQYELLKIKYPAIMKPRFGSGSRDIYYIENNIDLRAAYDDVINRREDFVLEQLIIGKEYSVDGAVINNKLFITLLREKLITSPPVRQPIASFSVKKDVSNSNLYKRVRDKLEKVINVLEYDDCLLNADLIINDEDVFVIEIAPRPSGHNLHDVFTPLATGIDIANEYINYMLGKQYCFENNIVKMIEIRFFDFSNVILYEVPHENVLREAEKCNLVMWNCNIKPGMKLGRVENGKSLMGRGFFIVEGDDKENIEKQNEYILSQFKYERI